SKAEIDQLLAHRRNEKFGIRHALIVPAHAICATFLRMQMTRGLVVSGMLLSASVSSAQPPGPQGPPRDTRPAAVLGTASIKGRVFAADTGRPLRRARITLTAPELGREQRTTSTNQDGRYEVKELPAGRYTIRVARSGYLPLQYGQRRPLEQGKPLQIIDRQAVENIDFTLPRSSVITGRIMDETNEPIADVQVSAMRSMYYQGRRRLVPAGPPSRTDDAGEYRIIGLVPGTYYVMARLNETWTVSEGGVEEMMGYAPTYFPGTIGMNDARRVTIGVGQIASNTNFPLVPGRAASVSGTAYDSTG